MAPNQIGIAAGRGNGPPRSAHPGASTSASAGRTSPALQRIAIAMANQGSGGRPIGRQQPNAGKIRQQGPGGTGPVLKSGGTGKIRQQGPGAGSGPQPKSGGVWTGNGFGAGKVRQQQGYAVGKIRQQGPGGVPVRKSDSDSFLP